jgi:hypothetical protein
VILAQVSFEVCAQPTIRLPQELLQIPHLLVRALLRSREPIEALSDLPEAVSDVLQAVCDMGNPVRDVPKAVGDVPDVVSEVREVVSDVPDDARQADEPVSDPVGLCGEPFEICRKLCLLMQQKLHRPFNLVRGHRPELHDTPSNSVWSRHYAIVLPHRVEQAEYRRDGNLFRSPAV